MEQNYSSNGKNHQVVVLMVPLPAQGHLNQLLHLSHCITGYGIPVHYAGSSAHNRQAKLRLHGWGSEILSKIHFHDLQLPPYESTAPDIDPFNPYPKHLQSLFETSMLLRHPMSLLIKQFSDKFRKVMVIHDILMTTVVQDVKIIPNAQAYTLFPTCAFFYSTYFLENLPEKDKSFQLEYSKDLPEYIPPFGDRCVPDNALQHAKNQMECLGFESGWLYNTSRVIEGKYIELLEKLTSTKDIVHFPIGPFLPTDMRSQKGGENRHQCLQWLDEQEKDSVIYVSFGSTTSMTDEQIEELANGLERCGEKFLWVLRRADPTDVFAEADKVKRPQLPQGYEDRVKGRGMVLKDWAPQLEILAHSSAGGFMSHCGWNSSIESITMGVPIAAWPMHSDQPRIATLITQVLSIGVMVKDWERHGELVKSNTIENVVKKLMASKEGKEMQKRAKQLGEAVKESVAEGGISRLAMDNFINHVSR